MTRIVLQNTAQFPKLPKRQHIQRWVDATIQALNHIQNAEKKSLTIRFVTEQESAQLNTYRHKQGPTNVLAFPEETTPGFASQSFGDLAVCAPVVLQEAKNQDKMVEAHFAHLIIHGLLHLNGYDHINEADAQVMENLEVLILAQLGYDNPYDMRDTRE